MPLAEIPWILWIVLVVLLFLVIYQAGRIRRLRLGTPSAHVALIRLRGTIQDGPASMGFLRSEGSSADQFRQAFSAAARGRGVRAICLEIQSPGGAPVASSEIADMILSYREGQFPRLTARTEGSRKPPVKVYALIRGLGASGAYLVASVCDEIWCNPSSLVGSIGVISTRFGVPRVLDRYGVEVREQTAGVKKNMLSPFREEDPEARALWQQVLDSTHQQFVGYVQSGRGDRLAMPDQHELFSGLVWSGVQAKALGLVDHLGGLDNLRDKVQKGIPFRAYGVRKSRGLRSWLGLTWRLFSQSESTPNHL